SAHHGDDLRGCPRARFPDAGRQPEQCRIHKGYFPESAAGLNEKFCFVNLDLDLYDPTYQGLWFFQDKMTDSGVILVHDYYSLYDAGEYKGVRAAVDRFFSEYTGDIRKYPIGDGYSVMLAGFWNAGDSVK
ncbi:MAG: hypothetical protein HFG00_12935, partial [Oscillibacter sp.]|nr:hypothetical protein [Oscillibacter sp.]